MPKIGTQNINLSFFIVVLDDAFLQGPSPFLVCICCLGVKSQSQNVFLMWGRKQNSMNMKQEENKETNEKITKKLAKIYARKIAHI